jgi:hypothetical protein
LPIDPGAGAPFDILETPAVVLDEMLALIKIGSPDTRREYPVSDIAILRISGVLAKPGIERSDHEIQIRSGAPGYLAVFLLDDHHRFRSFMPGKRVLIYFVGGKLQQKRHLGIAA